MKVGLHNVVIAVVILLLLRLNGVIGIRFEIDREECFSHNVEYEGDTVIASFVVISIDSTWQYTQEGVDLVVKGPSGNQIQDLRGRITEKFEFVAEAKGVYRFCFTNMSPNREKLDFDVHSNHFSIFDQHAQDEHFTPLLEQIIKIEEALFNIQYEQHWLEAQTERQAILNDAMNSRAMHKAILESAALIGASTLQVYLLRRLFERKFGI